jgi:Winged helix DNA-binding domain
MNKPEIALRRLRSQGLEQPGFKKPGEVVAWLGAVQAQDYAGAKWSVAQRAKGLTDAALDKAFADGAILRTHLLRPTWHFVGPADIRWMLALTAPRVNAVNAYMYRKLELDDAVFKRSNDAITQALEGGQQLTRTELGVALERSGLVVEGFRLSYLMMRAELDGVVCGGPRRGKHFTYALLEERVPSAKPLDRAEALAELTRRYFTSRGPATLRDFVWWSGLSVTEAKVGMEAVKAQFVQETVENQTYWLAASAPKARTAPSAAYLLPMFDEYLLSYKDRSASVSDEYAKIWARVSDTFGSSIVMAGRTGGCWRRDFERGAVALRFRCFRPLSEAEQHALTLAAERYGAFLGMAVVLEGSTERGKTTEVFSARAQKID